MELCESLAGYSRFIVVKLTACPELALNGFPICKKVMLRGLIKHPYVSKDFNIKILLLKSCQNL